MSRSILVADAISTNRIVIRTKLAAAFYNVQPAGSGAAVLREVGRARPDAILLSDTLTSPSAEELCQILKADPDMAPIPVMLIVGGADQRARISALRAGADEVISRPFDDAGLLARIRSLLRARDAEAELHLRDDTERALGFAEARHDFDAPSTVALVASNAALRAQLAAPLTKARAHRVRCIAPEALIQDAPANLDVIVLALSPDHPGQDLSLLSELRSRPSLRHAGIVVVVPEEAQGLAPQALDLGANDILVGGSDTDELLLRLTTQVRRKRTSDRLRDTLRSGLRAAVTDPLTGLYNRRYAEPHLARLVAQSRRTGRPCTVMVADIDHFKRVNDTYGHAVGDLVLTQIADRLRGNLRDRDLVARTGGEEFLIVMPETSRDEAHVAAERLRELVRGSQIGLPDGRGGITVTISIGVAVAEDLARDTSPDDESEEAGRAATNVLEIADKALYAAKSRGRDRIRVGPPCAA
ncbi:diguanylate cyclase [Mesobacterium pallidum]|uniref:diguanylate cyclase n=1 Tax=Mesobacterium pallidum TaxID=2872037 RepID=UPI001EE1AC16|nr:diguanylate cyclase [Mesobacterium pallidum]